MLVFAPALLFGAAAALFASISAFAPAPDGAQSRRLAGWAVLFAVLTFAAVCAVVLWGVAIWLSAVSANGD